MMRLHLLSLVGAAVLAGCAADGVVVETVGAPLNLADGHRFVFDVDPGAGEAGRHMQSLISQRLTEAGAGLASPSSAPYRVEIGYGSRPQSVGSYAGRELPPSADRSLWLDPPGRSRWSGRKREICTLILRFTDPATGLERFRSRAVASGDKTGCLTVEPKLTDALFERLQPKPIAPAR